MFTEKSNGILEEKQVILGSVLFEHQIIQTVLHIHVCMYLYACVHTYRHLWNRK